MCAPAEILRRASDRPISRGGCCRGGATRSGSARNCRQPPRGRRSLARRAPARPARSRLTPTPPPEHRRCRLSAADCLPTAHCRPAAQRPSTAHCRPVAHCPPLNIPHAGTGGRASTRSHSYAHAAATLIRSPGQPRSTQGRGVTMPGGVCRGSAARSCPHLPSAARSRRAAAPAQSRWTVRTHPLRPHPLAATRCRPARSRRSARTRSWPPGAAPPAPPAHTRAAGAHPRRPRPLALSRAACTTRPSTTRPSPARSRPRRPRRAARSRRPWTFLSPPPRPLPGPARRARGCDWPRPLLTANPPHAPRTTPGRGTPEGMKAASKD